MKRFYPIILALLMFGCTQKTGSNEIRSENIATYDSAMATRLGADDYGMKQYVMAFLKRGPVRDQDSATVANIQRAHLDNIKRLANDGMLVLAGPFADDGDIRGIYLFNVETIEEAERLTSTDPAIKSGRLIMELHTWYGSAALLQVNEMQKLISKKEI